MHEKGDTNDTARVLYSDATRDLIDKILDMFKILGSDSDYM